MSGYTDWLSRQRRDQNIREAQARGDNLPYITPTPEPEETAVTTTSPTQRDVTIHDLDDPEVMPAQLVDHPTGLHRITERDDGPDLDDLVRLIRYLREHEITYRLEADPSGSTLRWQPADPASWPHIYEGHVFAQPEGIAFVGPDGTVYDENRETLVDLLRAVDGAS